MNDHTDIFDLTHPGLAALPEVPLGLDDDEIEWDQVDQLYQLVRNGPTQNTIAISGGWGSGKTSLMRLVQKRLAKDQEFPTVWFNAWRFENDPQLVIPLLLTIDHDLRQYEWL
jgi:Cdc6-like AAA superfamily ATPase